MGPPQDGLNVAPEAEPLLQGLPGLGRLLGGFFGPEQDPRDAQLKDLQILRMRRELGLAAPVQGVPFESLSAKRGVWFLAGATGSGKSVTARQLVRAYAKRNRPWAFVGRVPEGFPKGPVFRNLWEVPDGCCAFVDEVLDLASCLGERPPPELIEFAARIRHRDVALVVTGQSWNIYPRALLYVDMGQVYGCKSSGWAARAFCREELREQVQAAAGALSSVPPHPSVTAWVFPDGRIVTTINDDDGVKSHE